MGSGPELVAEPGFFLTDTVTADGILSGWGGGVVRKPKTLTSPGFSYGLPVHAAGLPSPTPEMNTPLVLCLAALGQSSRLKIVLNILPQINFSKDSGFEIQ